MKKQIKKGFTLVELLVVIAIIAILSVVSVVGYTSFTKKAKVSNDLSLTTQMNNILQSEETSGTKLNTPHDALVALEEGGLNISKLTPTTDGYIYVYNINGKNNERVILLDENYNVKAPQGLVLSSSKEDYFAFVSSDAEIKTYTEYGFSIYLKDTYKTNAAINVSTGFDIGNNTNVTTVNYTTTNKNNVVIRTNENTTLNINAANSTIMHYEAANKVNIEAVASNSYHEYGAVNNIEVKSGRVSVENTAKVQTVVVTGNSVKVESAVKNVEVKVASTVTTKPEVKVDGVVKEAESVKLVSSVLSNNNENNIVDGDYVVLANDITKIYLNASNNTFNNITVDLNGHNVISTGDFPVHLENANITIKGSGLIKTSYKEAIFVKNNSNLIISDVTVEAPEACVDALINSKVTINSGTFTSYDNFVVGTSGKENLGNNTITINGGTFNGYIKSSGYIACGIYAANNDTWNINGGTFNITNGCGILARSGVVNVSKDVVINLYNDENNTVTGMVGDKNVMVISGAALVLDNAPVEYPGGAPTLNNASSYGITTITKYN